MLFAMKGNTVAGSGIPFVAPGFLLTKSKVDWEFRKQKPKKTFTTSQKSLLPRWLFRMMEYKKDPNTSLRMNRRNGEQRIGR